MTTTVNRTSYYSHFTCVSTDRPFDPLATSKAESFNERGNGDLKQVCAPSEIIAFGVFSLLHHRLIRRDLVEIVALYRIDAGHVELRNRSTVAADRWCYLSLAIDRDET